MASVDFSAYVFTFVFIASGIWCLLHAAKNTRINDTIKKTPLVPIHQAEAGKPAWLRGKVVVKEPLYVPHLGFECIYYSSRLEMAMKPYHFAREIKKSDEAHSRFAIKNGNQQIEANTADGKLFNLSQNTIHDNFSYHIIYFYSSNETLSIFGVISDDKKSIEPWDNFPMLITTREPESFLQTLDDEAGFTRKSGYGLIMFGILVFIVAL